MRNTVRKLLILGCIAAILFGPVHSLRTVQSANLTGVSVTLSSPRLSFYGELDNSNSAGSTLVSLQNGQNAAPSTSAANLFSGDSVQIENSIYTVASVSAENTFTIVESAGLDAGDVGDGNQVIATRTAQLVVAFTTVSSLDDGGALRVLVPASGAVGNDDGIPDQAGWDYGSSVAANIPVTCPTPSHGSFTASQDINQSIGGQTYHVFTCTFADGGLGPLAPTSYTGFEIGHDTTTTQQLINPAPKTNHEFGYADTYKMIVQQLDGSANIVDQTVTDVAVIESVRITASVPPQIIFRILGVAAATSACGQNTSVATTATLVPLGELLIGGFKYAAQELVVATNAENGYTVTAIQDDQLKRVGATCTGDADETIGACIKDSDGDNTTMEYNNADVWISTDTKGFGYTLQSLGLDVDANGANGTNDSVGVHHAGTFGSCSGATSGQCWKQFADDENASVEAPQTIYSSTDVANNDNVYVCYKSIISATQQAGTDYSSAVTYRATASF